MERKDKELYSYKQALEQPTWIQKITDSFSLNNPLELSFLVYYFIFAMTIGGILWLLPVPISGKAKFAVGLVGGYFLASFAKEVKPDGKYFGRFIYDYIRFYLFIGLKTKKQYLNKGVWRNKPSYKKGE